MKIFVDECYIMFLVSVWKHHRWGSFDMLAKVHLQMSPRVATASCACWPSLLVPTSSPGAAPRHHGRPRHGLQLPHQPPHPRPASRPGGELRGEVAALRRRQPSSHGQRGDLGAGPRRDLVSRIPPARRRVPLRPPHRAAAARPPRLQRGLVGGQQGAVGSEVRLYTILGIGRSAVWTENEWQDMNTQ